MVKSKDRPRPPVKKRPLSKEEKTKVNSMLEDLIGTRGAYVLDQKMNILGKVPVSELQSTIKSLKTGIFAVIFDGVVDKELLGIAEKTNVQYLIAMDSKIKSTGRVNVLTADDL